MTCKDCYHYEACSGYSPSDLDKDVWDYCAKGKTDEIPDIEDRCSEFKNTADVVEVVRCKDCIYWEGRGYDGRCEAHRNGLIMEYTNYDDFCSYGKRKEGAEE